jgi:glycosyl transferase family 2
MTAVAARSRPVSARASEHGPHGSQVFMAAKLSAFVVTYNRASLLESCLHAASFADELIVIDKSSTDNSAEVAARHADRVERVPWSPTVEETRAFAASLCRHEWILCLDDDEILSPETGPYLQRHLAGWDADILTIPYRHYILGVHDERAYYWPEVRHCLFRRGTIEFIPTVHGGVVLQSDRIASIPINSGVCIHHLSYQDVAGWIERTNRYTSQPDRIRAAGGADHLIQFAHEQIDDWMRRTDAASGNDYPTAVALLRAVYDIVDRLKAWETDRGADGAELFRVTQQSLGLVGEGSNLRTPMQAGDADAVKPAATRSLHAASLGDLSDTMAMQGLLVQLRAAEAQSRERTAVLHTTSLTLTNVRRDLADTEEMLAATRHELSDTRARLRQTEAALEQNCAALDQNRAMLRETETRLNADLTSTRQQLEQLGSSARLFFRQYAPKLRRHLLQRFLTLPRRGGEA